MPVRWEGPKASYHGNIDKLAVTCTPNPKSTRTACLTLAAMTDKAISLSKSEKGFFPAGSVDVDKQDQELCGQIGETVDLDEGGAEVSLCIREKDGKDPGDRHRDHAYASQIIPADTKAPGLTQAPNTKDGAVIC